MARIKGGMNAKKKHNRTLKLAKGYRGARSKQYRVAKQSVMRAASAWARFFTCSHPAFSKIAATPLAPEKAQTSPRPFKISSKASALPLIHSIGPSGSPSTKLSSFEYAPTLAKLVFIFFTHATYFHSIFLLKSEALQLFFPVIFPIVTGVSVSFSNRAFQFCFSQLFPKIFNFAFLSFSLGFESNFIFFYFVHQ